MEKPAPKQFYDVDEFRVWLVEAHGSAALFVLNETLATRECRPGTVEVIKWAEVLDMVPHNEGIQAIKWLRNLFGEELHLYISRPDEVEELAPFRVREGVYVDVPADLTAEEATGLANFILTIPGRCVRAKAN